MAFVEAAKSAADAMTCFMMPVLFKVNIAGLSENFLTMGPTRKLRRRSILLYLLDRYHLSPVVRRRYKRLRPAGTRFAVDGLLLIDDGHPGS